MADTLLLYTQNITRNAISWTPPVSHSASGANSNTELLHAVHVALHFALDPCTDHPGEAPSFAFDDGRLVVPREVDLRRSREGGDGEVSAKMFFFEPPSLVAKGKGKEQEAKREGYVKEALDALARATGRREVQRFVVKLEDVAWDGREEWAESGMEDVKGVGPLWQYLSSEPRIKSLGVSDFSSAHLSQLFSTLSSLPSADVKPPTSDHLNLFDCDNPPCLNPPDDLQVLAGRKGVELVAHSDDGQILPIKGLIGLLTEFEQRLPLPESFKKARDVEQPEKAVAARWVLKYTVVIRSRGLLVDKGYIVSAEFPR